jgi:hypothetical protein
MNEKQRTHKTGVKNTKARHALEVQKQLPQVGEDTRAKTKQQIQVANDGIDCPLFYRRVRINIGFPFSKIHRRILRQITRDLAELSPFTPEEFEILFRWYGDPHKKLGIWHKIAFQYKRCIASGTPSENRKQDYLELCYGWQCNEADGLGKDGVVEATALREMTRQEARELLDSLSVVPSKCLGGPFAKQFPDMVALDFTSICSPEGFKTAVKHADMILALDWLYGDSQWIYGVRTAEAKKGKYHKTSGVNVLAIVLNWDSPWLDALFARMLKFKGSYEWDGKVYTEGEN